MCLIIHISVVPIENWLLVTHNQIQKSLKVAAILLFCHILKTTSRLECSSSLLNSTRREVIGLLHPTQVEDQWNSSGVIYKP